MKQRLHQLIWASAGILLLWPATSLRAQSEPEAVLVRSNSPLVAARLADALKTAGVSERAYRIQAPTGAGSLPSTDVVELERRAVAANKNFGKAASDIIILVKVITKGSEMEQLVRDALKDVDRSLYQMEVVKGKTGPEAILVKSDSPVVAAKATEALKAAGVSERAYRIKVPTGAGSLPSSEVVQLERRAVAANKNFGKAASDIIILVKVITKGSEMEQLVRNALKDVDRSLYQIEVVKR